MLLYPSPTGALGLDRLRVQGDGLPFWLAELPLEDLQAVPGYLAALVSAAEETASVPSA